MSGFVFGENNSSFDYDNKFDRLMLVLEQIVRLQQETIEEIKDLKSAIENRRSDNDFGKY